MAHIFKRLIALTLVPCQLAASVSPLAAPFMSNAPLTAHRETFRREALTTVALSAEQRFPILRKAPILGGLVRRLRSTGADSNGAQVEGAAPPSQLLLQIHRTVHAAILIAVIGTPLIAITEPFPYLNLDSAMWAVGALTVFSLTTLNFGSLKNGGRPMWHRALARTLLGMKIVVVVAARKFLRWPHSLQRLTLPLAASYLADTRRERWAFALMGLAAIPAIAYEASTIFPFFSFAFAPYLAYTALVIQGVSSALFLSLHFRAYRNFHDQAAVSEVGTSEIYQLEAIPEIRLGLFSRRELMELKGALSQVANVTWTHNGNLVHAHLSPDFQAKGVAMSEDVYVYPDSPSTSVRSILDDSSDRILSKKGALGFVALDRYTLDGGQPVLLINAIQPVTGYRALPKRDRKRLDGWRVASINRIARVATEQGYTVIGISADARRKLHPNMHEYEINSNYQYDSTLWKLVTLDMPDDFPSKDKSTPLWAYVSLNGSSSSTLQHRATNSSATWSIEELDLDHPLDHQDARRIRGLEVIKSVDAIPGNRVVRDLPRRWQRQHHGDRAWAVRDGAGDIQALSVQTSDREQKPVSISIYSLPQWTVGESVDQLRQISEVSRAVPTTNFSRRDPNRHISFGEGSPAERRLSRNPLDPQLPHEARSGLLHRGPSRVWSPTNTHRRSGEVQNRTRAFSARELPNMTRRSGREIFWSEDERHEVGRGPMIGSHARGHAGKHDKNRRSQGRSEDATDPDLFEKATPEEIHALNQIQSSWNDNLFPTQEHSAPQTFFGDTLLLPIGHDTPRSTLPIPSGGIYSGDHFVCTACLIRTVDANGQIHLEQAHILPNGNNGYQGKAVHLPDVEELLEVIKKKGYQRISVQLGVNPLGRRPNGERDNLGDKWLREIDRHFRAMGVEMLPTLPHSVFVPADYLNTPSAIYFRSALTKGEWRKRRWPTPGPSSLSSEIGDPTPSLRAESASSVEPESSSRARLGSSPKKMNLPNNTRNRNRNFKSDNPIHDPLRGPMRPGEFRQHSLGNGPYSLPSDPNDAGEPGEALPLADFQGYVLAALSTASGIHPARLYHAIASRGTPLAFNSFRQLFAEIDRWTSWDKNHFDSLLHEFNLHESFKPLATALAELEPQDKLNSDSVVDILPPMSEALERDLFEKVALSTGQFLAVLHSRLLRDHLEMPPIFTHPSKLRIIFAVAASVERASPRLPPFGPGLKESAWNAVVHFMAAVDASPAALSPDSGLPPFRARYAGHRNLEREIQNNFYWIRKLQSLAQSGNPHDHAQLFLYLAQDFFPDAVIALIQDLMRLISREIRKYPTISDTEMRHTLDQGLARFYARQADDAAALTRSQFRLVPPALFNPKPQQQLTVRDLLSPIGFAAGTAGILVGLAWLVQQALERSPDRNSSERLRQSAA